MVKNHDDNMNILLTTYDLVHCVVGKCQYKTEIYQHLCHPYLISIHPESLFILSTYFLLSETDRNCLFPVKTVLENVSQCHSKTHDTNTCHFS